MAKLALQQIYSKLNQSQDSLGLAVAAYKRINESPLFDPIYYAARYGDVSKSGLEPIAHYVIFGAAEGRATHPLFNGPFYKQQLVAKGIRAQNPLKHYLDNAHLAELWPNPLFDPKFYLSQLSEQVTNPLEHYLLEGAKNDLDPFPLFDTSFYARQYKDADLGYVNPLAHFLLIGAFDGRPPHPLFEPAYYASSLGIENLDRMTIAGTTSEEKLCDLYRQAVLANPDPDNAPRINPVIHYIDFGAAEERDAHPIFSTRFYLNKYPDVRNSDLNPLVHYVLNGQKELRQPHEMFDPVFYLAQIKEPPSDAVAKPLEHFIWKGGPAGLSPHPTFDSKFYLERYPDVAVLKFNPLIHYLKLTAMGQHLTPNPSFDGEFYASVYADVGPSQLSAIEHYASHGTSQKRKTNFFDWAIKQGIDHGYDRQPIAREQLQPFRKKSSPTASIILFGEAREDDLFRCLYSLSNQTSDISFEVIATPDECTSQLSTQLELSILPETQKNETDACNAASKIAAGRILVFLRKNMFVLNGWLNELVSSCLSDQRIGSVCSTTVSALGRIINAGAHVTDDGNVRANWAHYDPFGLKELIPVEVCPRGSLAIPTELFRRVNGYDASIGSALYQDVDLSRRLQFAGFNIYCNPLSRAVSLGEYDTHTIASSSSHEDAEWRQRYLDACAASTSAGSASAAPSRPE